MSKNLQLRPREQAPARTRTRFGASHLVVPGVLATLALLAAACGDHGRPGIPEIEPPPRYQQLEPAVRQQFEDSRAELERARQLPEEQGADALGLAWGRMGQWFHVYRFPDSAMRCYREATRLQPEEAHWPYYLGLLAVEAGELDQAAMAFERAARRAPDSPAMPVRLAELMLQQRKPERARSYFLQALALDPDYPGAVIGMARLQIQARQAKEALNTLQALHSADERFAGHVSYLRAQAQRQLGRHDEARRLLESIPDGEAKASAPSGDDPWLDELMKMNVSSNHLTRLGMRAYRRGDFRRAAHYAGRASGLNPDNAELRTNYAAALLALGRTRDALEQVGRALDQRPDLARAYLVRAGALSRAGRTASARDALIEGLALDPDMREARQQLGLLYQQSGQTELAIEQYAQLRQGSPELLEVRLWHAALLASAGRSGEALGALDEDLAVHPRSAPLQLMRVRVMATAGNQSTDANRAAALLAELNEPRVDVYYAETAAMVAASRGDHELAIAWQERAVEALEALRDSGNTHIARRRLTLYREGKTCRTPWEASEALITKPVDRPEGFDEKT